MGRRFSLVAHSRLKYHAARKYLHTEDSEDHSLSTCLGDLMISRYKLLLLVVVVLAVMSSVPASAQTPFLGEIRYVGFNFAPKGWALCEGQILAINANTALFTLLGTTFGGNGTTTFALPDMRGRVPVAWGQGPGLSNRNLGEQGGQESVALTVPQMPAHRHQIVASSATANTKAPAGNVLANSSSAAIYNNAAPDVKLANKALSVAGQGLPHENMQPYLGMTCIIALEGIYPSPN